MEQAASPARSLRWSTTSGTPMSAFGLYIIGFFVLLAGLGYGAFLLHVPQTWIVVGALIIIGLGVMSAVSHTKRRDPPADSPSL
jgi:hypothetical protein